MANNKRPSKSVASAIDPKTGGVVYAIPKAGESQEKAIERVLIKGHGVDPLKIRKF